MRSRRCALVRLVGSQFGRQANHGDPLIRSRRRSIQTRPWEPTRWADEHRVRCSLPIAACLRPDAASGNGQLGPHNHQRLRRLCPDGRKDGPLPREGRETPILGTALHPETEPWPCRVPSWGNGTTAGRLLGSAGTHGPLHSYWRASTQLCGRRWKLA